MKSNLFLILCLFIPAVSHSQDPQFSQYYNAPLILNPALAGATDCYRAGMNARSQWGGLPRAFNTASIFADLNYPDLRSGFGLMALYDDVGTPRLTSAEISGFYSYEASFSDQVNFRFGLQGTYVSRSIDYTDLIFEDQFTGIVVTDPTKDEIVGFNKTNYADFSAGIIMYGDDRYWLGFSAHHLNRPDQAFYSDQITSRLPIKYSIHGGYNFYRKQHPMQREEDWMRIIPTFMYKAQARFDQVDLGIYLIKDPIILGAWYRGVFVKEDEGIIQNDALVLHAGFQYSDFSFTYSYDITTSRLQWRNTYGSHEISLIYLFCLEWPPRRKPSRRARKLPCPDFQRSRKYKGNGKGF